MSTAERFNLTKATETFDRFLLAKGVNNAPTMRVGLALDISGSMSGIINRGDLQLAVNQIVPVGLKFDDNGEVDVFQFDNRCDHVGTMDANNFESFVRDNRIQARGGTEYAPIVQAALKFFFPQGAAPGGKSLLGGLFGKKPAAPAAAPGNEPALVLIITDGDCSDRAAAEQAFRDSEQYNIYWHFVAVGSASFSTIKYLADKLPNVGDVYLRDFGMSTEQVYEQVVCDELVGWIKQR